MYKFPFSDQIFSPMQIRKTTFNATRASLLLTVPLPGFLKGMEGKHTHLY